MMRIPALRHARRLTSAIAPFVVGATLVTSSLGMAPSRRIAATDSVPLHDSANVVMPQFLGFSGKLRALQVTPERIGESPALAAMMEQYGIASPGIHQVGLTSPDGQPVALIALIPFAAKNGGTFQGYRIGYWPRERRSVTLYGLPDGFIEVTEENQDVALSSRFHVRDFLTKDQGAVWPKYLVIQPTLLDKLELIADALELQGKPSAIKVLSGFRTPQYNAKGVCRRCGRAKDSRHMYGDASDIYVDGDGNGVMDDLNGDGKVSIADARFLAAIADQVESEHPELTGGIGIYRATGAHGPFVHVDTRGFVARWGR
jgi:uncharacterized protein YcbK (DUF882 family)